MAVPIPKLTPSSATMRLGATQKIRVFITNGSAANVAATGAGSVPAAAEFKALLNSIEVGSFSNVVAHPTIKYAWDVDFTAPAELGEITIELAAAAFAEGTAGSGSSAKVTTTVTTVGFRTGRAIGNPAAKNYGSNILGIVAEQGDYFTPVKLASASPDPREVGGLSPDIVELRPPYQLTPQRQFYPVERLKGNPTPDPAIPGMLMGAGQLSFYTNPSSVSFWLKHLLQATSVTTRSFGDISGLVAKAEVTAGNTATIAAQPAAEIAKLVSPPVPPAGMRAAKLEITADSPDANSVLSIRGRDQNNTPISEEITVLASINDDDTFVTRWYYRHIDSIKASTDITFAVGAKLSASTTHENDSIPCPGVYEHVFSFSSDVSEGLTLEIQEGNIDSPITYKGLLLSRGVFRLEDLPRMQLMVMANEVSPREAMHGGSTGTSLTNANWNRPDFHAASAAGAAWEVRGENVPSDMRGIFRIADTALAVDNRIAPPETSYADDFFYPKPVRKGNREVQMQVAVDYSKEADFDQFVGGLTFESIFFLTSRLYGDAYRELRFSTKQAQIINNPQRVVNGLGEVLQQIVVRSHIGSAPLGNDDAEFCVINTTPGA